MKKNIFKKVNRRFRKGLTLVELAVVVLIMGSIITLVALNINPGELKDDTASLKLRKDANELAMQLERYAEKYGKYPSEEQGLSALVEKPTTGDVPEDWRPILNKKNAILDPWGTPYQLKKDPNSDDYMIVTLGKDKKDGGEGKDADFNIRDENTYPQAFRKK
ncbi:MAG: type II secretion system major pseudopilin GspG [Leptospiraceae bacterium]|nr:type II secretion system major pseudopilin GspG [Leptospiraceae bacterium]MCK6379838.1 type II secretion system major pseudopilin GspG [Leptospiraceae bacterium]NUM40970.1 type II secretion system major pseudopilin GspG [Leptospiraceae bacterium]